MATIRRIVILLFALACTSEIAFADPPTSADCTNDTPFADAENCTTYYQCFLIDTGWFLVHLDCPPGGIWDDTSKACIEGFCEAPTTTTTPAPTTTTAIPTTSTTPPSTASTTTTTTTPKTTTTTTKTPTTTTSLTTTSTTPSTPPAFRCFAEGFFAHPTDPTKYYQCVLISSQFYYYLHVCPPNACFQSSAGMCVIGGCNGNTPPTTAITTTTPTTTTTTKAPEPDHPCPSEGYFGDPQDCQAYYRCIMINGHMYRYMYRCPATSYWNQNLQGCIVGPCPARNLLAETTTTSTATTTKAPTTTSASTFTTTGSTTSGPVQITCTSAGFFPHPTICTSYYQCVTIRGRWVYYTYSCPPFTKFDGTRKQCVIGAC